MLTHMFTESHKEEDAPGTLSNIKQGEMADPINQKQLDSVPDASEATLSSAKAVPNERNYSWSLDFLPGERNASNDAAPNLGTSVNPDTNQNNSVAAIPDNQMHFVALDMDDQNVPKEPTAAKPSSKPFLQFRQHIGMNLTAWSAVVWRHFKMLSKYLTNAAIVLTLVGLGLLPVILTVALVLARPTEPFEGKQCNTQLARLFLIIKMVLYTSAFAAFALDPCVEWSYRYRRSWEQGTQSKSALGLTLINAIHSSLFYLTVLWIITRIAWVGFGLYLFWGRGQDLQQENCPGDPSVGRLSVAINVWFSTAWVLVTDMVAFGMGFIVGALVDWIR
ncbi:hypothetical protein HDU93_003482, partial [Gonapodya sp. JEL0774]